MPVLAEMDKPSFERFSPKKEEGTEKSYGGGGGRHPGGGGKQKRSFLQKAKRFGKQGRLGRGFEVDSETYSYFVKILEVLKQDDFETDDDREMFVENSLNLTEGNEVQLSSNQLVSRVIETILPFASEDTLARFGQAFTPSLRVIVEDPFASHVLEALLEITSADKWRKSEKLTEWFGKTSMFILNNFEDFTFQTYSSFVMKKVLDCLSGFVLIPTEKNPQLAIFRRSSLQSLVKGARQPYPKWEKMLQDFAKRFFAWPQFNDLVQKPVTARLLQNVLEAVSRTGNSEPMVEEFVLKILSAIPAPVEVSAPVAHRILEVCLSVSNDVTYSKILNDYYKGSLVQLSRKHPHFTIKKIISTAPNSQSFQAVYNELSPEIANFVRDGKIELIQIITAHCIKLGTLQKEFFIALQSAIKDVYGKDSNLLLSLISIGHQQGDNPREKSDSLSSGLIATYFGTLTAEQLMDFGNPFGINIIKSLNELDSSKIRKLTLDRKGSFMVSKFFKSYKVPRAEKVKLLHKLKESLTELAMTTFGSRIMDEIWMWADIAEKIVVAEVLSERIPQLAANKFGRFMVENMGLNAFKRDRKEWLEHMTSADKRKQDAKDIAAELGLTTPGSLKGKKNAESNETADSTEETPKKKKKNRKSEVTNKLESSLNVTSEETAVSSTSSEKKKNKKRKSEIVADLSESKEELETETPKKKKKNRKSEAVEAELDMAVEEEQVETAHKKKKKNRKSEAVDEESVLADDLGQDETPKKKNKRKSGKGNDSIEQQIDESPKKKDRKSKSKN